MQASIFLARLLGIGMLIIGVGILINQSYYRGMTRELFASRPFFFIVSMIGVVGGLAVVLVHNVWVMNWRVLITLLGWFHLIRGALSIVLPEKSFAVGSRMVGSQHMPMIAGVVAAIVGLILCYFGFTAKG